MSEPRRTHAKPADPRNATRASAAGAAGAAGAVKTGGEPQAVENGDAETGTADGGRPSKTRLKRQMHELQALGVRLVELAPGRVADLPLNDDLRQAIEIARNTRSHEGRRRQLQYVGRLMRRADAEAIRSALAGDDLMQRRQVAHHHTAEQWRDGLISGRLQLEAWWRQFPVPVDGERDDWQRRAQRLVSLLETARGEGPPATGAGRALYRALHDWLGAL